MTVRITRDSFKEEWRHLKNTLELNYKNKVLFSLAMPQ